MVFGMRKKGGAGVPPGEEGHLRLGWLGRCRLIQGQGRGSAVAEEARSEHAGRDDGVWTDRQQEEARGVCALQGRCWSPVEVQRLEARWDPRRATRGVLGTRGRRRLD